MSPDDVKLPVVDIFAAPGAEDGLQLGLRNESKLREDFLSGLEERDEEFLQRRHLQLEGPQRPLQALVVHRGNQVHVLRNVLMEKKKLSHSG